MRRTCLTEFYKRERGPGPSVTAGVPVFVTQRNIKYKTMSQTSWLGLISIGIGLEGGGINDSLVVHQLVTLVVREGEELVGLGISSSTQAAQSGKVSLPSWR